MKDSERRLATKKEADYTPKGTQQEHCAICRHYQGGICDRVQGRVVAAGWCRFFSRRREAA
jgi:hypothetical protein